ncbi:MAG: hypothetical protein C4288_14020 [Leptolyngbya sp. ERB_1_1]
MRNRHWIIAVTGIALLSISCQSNRTPQAKIQPSPQVFAQPIVPAKPSTLPTIKVPGMIPTSDSKAPLMPVAVSSTRDPFAATIIPTDLKVAIQPATPKPIAAKSPTNTPPVIPPLTIRYSPIAPLPALSPALRIPRTNLANTIALTGVIQTGSQLSAIVQDADGSSRYVQAGEALANGQVIIKKINLNSAENPSIVLLENGIELIKMVGSEG